MFKNKKMLLQAGVSVLLCVIVFVYILQTNLRSEDTPPSPTSATTAVLEDLPPVEFTAPASGDDSDSSGYSGDNGSSGDNDSGTS